MTNSVSAWWRASEPLTFLPLLYPRDPVESTKSTLKSREGGIGIIAGLFFFPPSKVCAVPGALWFRLKSKWKQCCFFSFTPPPSSRTACQNIFSWIISDTRGPRFTCLPCLPPRPTPLFAWVAWPSLGQLIGCTWLKWTVCYPHAKGAMRKLLRLLL